MRVKDLSKLILGKQEVLVEMFMHDSTNAGIIIPEAAKKSNIFDYAVVIKSGEDVLDINKGDVVLDTRMKNIESFKFGEKLIATLSRSSITAATPADNFNFENKPVITA